MKKKLISLISAALCLCMVLSACGGPANSDPSPSASGSQSGDDTQDKTLTIATMTETTSLSPLYMGVYNYSMCTMLYETLLKYEDGEVKGNLAGCGRNAVAQSNRGGRLPDGPRLCWHWPLHL